MGKIPKSNLRITEFLVNNRFSRSDNVLDTTVAGSYEYIEARGNDDPEHGYETGVIVGVVVFAFIGAFVFVLLYLRRRPGSQTRNWCFPKVNINKKLRTEKLQRRKSHGIKEMIRISASTEFSALQPEQQQWSPVHVYRPNLKSARSSTISEVNTVTDPKTRPGLPQKYRAKFPESSWLTLTPNNLDRQLDVETAGRPATARTSRVTIPSYYYHYYRKHLDQDSYRVQSQSYPESQFSSDLMSYRDRSSRGSIYQKRGNSTHHERTPTLSQPLVADRNFINDDKNPSKPPADLDPNLAYFEFDIQLPHKPKQAIHPPSSRRSRGSMDTYESYIQYQGRRKKNRQTASSIATVSTAPIFRQHPGDEVDLESLSRVGRARSSLLNGLIIR
ncbi:hypothetical protein EYB25_005928 [Talaromyces marneffei]|uniref:uncharacterized protein n=1 Tax=Talaromyces marneffei TaxID=37727 RepID=UPI0012A9D7D1|nr:uncharacterized protein EYB26_006777 [Talaromyces marneffei]KAE8552037.1 hypothetical protein EYB25_005928 [Talaromyces marneffei]QGA19089.1 hypothetical protein EYB26_006777 [Talaromyces marneffei]